MSRLVTPPKRSKNLREKFLIRRGKETFIFLTNIFFKKVKSCELRYFADVPKNVHCFIFLWSEICGFVWKVVVNFNIKVLMNQFSAFIVSLSFLFIVCILWSQSTYIKVSYTCELCPRDSYDVVSKGCFRKAYHLTCNNAQWLEMPNFDQTKINFHSK